MTEMCQDYIFYSVKLYCEEFTVSFNLLRGHEKEAAASVRSCDSSGSVLGFPSLQERGHEGGINHFSHKNVEREFSSSGDKDLILDHLTFSV